MMDDAAPYNSQVSGHGFDELSGSLRRALYLWERQPPANSRTAQPESVADGQIAEPPIGEADTAPHLTSFNVSASADHAIEDQLKRHAARLSALERIIPGDKRLDPPRFSLMMLNAFLGRATTDRAVLAGLPGLFSISDRIDCELADLEFEYPDALQELKSEPDPTPILIRDEMRALFDGLKSVQKSQHRQIVSSLAALHTAIHDIRTHLPDRAPVQEPSHGTPTRHEGPPDRNIPVDDLARPLIDTERLVDPRPVLAAARAAASRANRELSDQPENAAEKREAGLPEARPYKSVLLGSAVLGILMILFGRDAVQFFSASNLSHGMARP